MSARDELAEVIRGIDGPATLGGLEVADAILAAGYTKPRTITTAEELDALPGWSIVEVRGWCLVRSSTHEACWVSTSGHFAYSSASLMKNHGPATVLHEPTA